MPPKVAPGTAHDGRKLGAGAHRVVARLLNRGIRRPTTEDLLAEVARDPALDQPHHYRLAARQRLLTASAIYFRFFARDDEWSFVDSEVPVTDGRLDLLFEHSDGRREADELKTASATDYAFGSRLDSQLASQLAGGTQRFGETFGGVSVLLVGAPTRSFHARPDGKRVPLDKRRGR